VDDTVGLETLCSFGIPGEIGDGVETERGQRIQRESPSTGGFLGRYGPGTPPLGGPCTGKPKIKDCSIGKKTSLAKELTTRPLCRERIAKVLNAGGGSLGPDDRNHVEPGLLFQQAMALEKRQGSSGQLALFGVVDRLGRLSLPGRSPSFYFHEYDCTVFDGDQIQFTKSRAIPASDDLKSSSFEVLGSDCLASFAKSTWSEQIGEPGA